MVRVILCVISILSNAYRVVLWPRIWSWSPSQVCMKRIFCWLSRYKCQLRNSCISFLMCCLLMLWIAKGQVLKSLHCNCELAWFSLQSCLCCRYFELLLWGTHIFRILVSSWWTEFFDILKCSSLCLVTVIVLKSDCKIAFFL